MKRDGWRGFRKTMGKGKHEEKPTNHRGRIGTRNGSVTNRPERRVGAM
jgi:hypothetical protein